MGGLESDDLEPTDHPLEAWQKTTRAMRQVLGDSKREIICVDELRRAIEDLPQDQYLVLSYFDRWIRAIGAILIEKNILTKKEITARANGLRSQRLKSVGD